MSDLVVLEADLGCGRRGGLRASRGRIVEIGKVDRAPGDLVLHAGGGAVVPGLHDHHVHLLALAAAHGSVRVGPPEVTDPGGFRGALVRADRAAPPGRWLRAVGYHESVAGPLDRRMLDAVVVGRPLRVQHRSGALWVLNSRALREVGLHDPGLHDPGCHDLASGRLFRADRWLAHAIGQEPVDLRRVAAAAAAAGITGFTDATPHAGTDELRALAAGVTRGEVPQRLVVMTAPGADVRWGEMPVARGPVKILLDDDRLPDLDGLVGAIHQAHEAGRAVAVHCVTRVQTVLTVSAIEAAGTVGGDRIEHGSVLPAELLPALARLGVTVVTNPGFVRTRGDAYLVDVDAEDLGDLYRCRTLVASGVPVAAGTDAPFGPADPWAVISAAVSRSTERGAVLGRDERIPAEQALDLFLGAPDAPARPRELATGADADLCLLSVPLEEALRAPSAESVAVCVIRGEVVFRRQ